MAVHLKRLYQYHQWADKVVMEAIVALDTGEHRHTRDATLKLMGHIAIVGRIYIAHLTGKAHGFMTDSFEEAPDAASLSADLAVCDRWYLDYVSELDPARLGEWIAFAFTDGDRGCMSREEMLMHVALHATVHRGEIARLLWTAGITPPWDTFAVHLHQAEPERRTIAA